MKARLKQALDKLLMRNVTYELREEVGQLRSEMAQVLRSLRSLEADTRRINSNVALLMQDVSIGQEALSDQILDAQRDAQWLAGEIQISVERIAPAKQGLDEAQGTKPLHS